MQIHFNKLKNIIVFSLIIGSFLLSCKTKTYTPTNFEGAQITFGSGGGFTGAVNKFTILENGQVFKNKKHQKTLEEQNRFKKKEVAPYFEKCKTLMKSYDFMDEPGNLYYFISLKNGEDVSRIVWSEEKQQASPEVLAFFQQLQNLVE